MGPGPPLSILDSMIQGILDTKIHRYLDTKIQRNLRYAETEKLGVSSPLFYRRSPPTVAPPVVDHRGSPVNDETTARVSDILL